MFNHLTEIVDFIEWAHSSREAVKEQIFVNRQALSLEGAHLIIVTHLDTIREEGVREQNGFVCQLVEWTKSMPDVPTPSRDAMQWLVWG